eukprot:scaffold6352_cov67-Phaeocystis_antarctica.AAC.2
MAAVEEKKGEAKEIEHVNPVPEEMSLPSAAIQRIIKSKLPEGVMIGKEAKVAFSKASSIFILYVTTMCASAPPAPRVVRLVRSSECRVTSLTVFRISARSANDLAKEARRTTVTAQDVLHALRDLEFDEFLPAVEACLHGAASPLRTPPVSVTVCATNPSTLASHSDPSACEFAPRAALASHIGPDTPPLARAAYKEQEKQKSLENAAKRAVKGGNTGADEEGGEAEAEEDVEAGGADEAEPRSKRQRTEGEEEEAEAE